MHSDALSQDQKTSLFTLCIFEFSELMASQLPAKMPREM